MSSIGIYAGSFDPFTKGHRDIAAAACHIFDKVVIAIGINPNKNPMFYVDERIAFIKKAMENWSDVPVEVTSFNGFLIPFANQYANPNGDYLQRNKVSIVRGLRALSDFEAEMAMASVNREMNRLIPTVFIPTNTDSAFVSSSMVKQIAFTEHNRKSDKESLLNTYVHTDVTTALLKKYEEYKSGSIEVVKVNT